MTGWNELGDSDDWLVVSSQSTRLEKPTLAASLWSKKEKQAPTKEKKPKKIDCTCPILWAPQRILHGTSNHLSTWCEDPIRWSSSNPPALLQIYLYAFHERSAIVIYLSRVTQTVGIWEGLNCGSRQGVFVIYLWQGEVMWPGHCVAEIFDNIWKTLTMNCEPEEREITICNEKTCLVLFLHAGPCIWLCHKIFYSQHITPSS